MSTSPIQKRYYPLFLALEGRRCLVVGGGSVGERKTRRLIQYGATVFLVAEHLSPWLKTQVQNQQLTHLGLLYRADFLLDMALVFAATNDPSLNLRIAADAREWGVLCNMASDPEAGDFILPSIFEQGSLTVAFSTSGMAPGVARIVRERFEADFGPQWVTTLDFLGRLRTEIQAMGISQADKHRIFTELAALSLEDYVARQDHEGLIQVVAVVCGQHLHVEQIRHLWEGSWKRLS